ncbi:MULTISPECIES: ABC transporter substrate-binding protein [Prochlorococcus]|uniref:ABC transporter substrate-binding protein n=1 Tax=Prochlorococcus TaxID=1218 RepID=UPI00053371BB|nr:MULTISPECIES: ABC transporter substrate-binding protein [Prochlorococcus]KGG12208.1 Oligopeptide ABC transporter [Prochlorococcus sp. MIT 0601]
MNNFLFQTKPKGFFQLTILIATSLLAFSQISCGPTRDSDRVIVASKGKIESLDPAQANKLLAIQLLSALGDPLYRINDEGVLEPRLASDQPYISKDGLTVSIPLRENVLFHDGTSFNSEAMAFSIRRFMDIGTLNYIIGGRIVDIETPNPFLIRIKLSRQSSSIKGLLTSINLTPISPTAYKNYQDKFLNKQFIGTGPYKLDSFSPERQRLIPFKGYWDGKPTNKGIDFISYTSSISLFSAMKTGQIDVLLSNSLEDGHRLALHKLSKKGKIIEGVGPAMQIEYIAFKSNSPPLNQKLIRQALSYSINRDLISKQVSYGLREPLRSIVPPVLQKEKQSKWPIYNPIKARKLYEKAGFCNQNILNIPLTFRSNVPADKLLALTWQSQIKRDFSDCIELKLNGVESTTVYKQLSEGSYNAVILGWTGEYPDPHAYLSPLLDCKKISDSICKEGEAVFGGTFWASNEIQKALDQTEILTGNKRDKKLSDIELLASKGGAILPIWLEKPRAWAQTNFLKPKFDGSGRLLLNQLQKEKRK